MENNGIMKLISGTFQKGCGVIVEHNGNYYHKIVFEDNNGKCFVEFDDKRIYESEVKKIHDD